MTEKEKQTGRKVFIIGFPETLQTELINSLVRREFEGYRIDRKYFDSVIVSYPRSVFMVYLNYDDNSWQSLLRANAEKMEDDDFQFIFFSDSPQNSTFERWPCIGLKRGVTEYIQQDIIAKLEALYARGQRKYIRFGGIEDVNVDFSFTINGKYYTGTVYDISSAGMSCTFDKETELPVNTPLPRIELTMQEKTYGITGKILLQRWLDNEKRLFVVMFDRRMPEKIRNVLQDFIHNSMQAKMELKLGQSY